MAVRQKVKPNLGVQAWRGWCLRYVDDAVNAPSKHRTPSAQAAYNVAAKKNKIRKTDLPVGVWVPIFFSLNAGKYKGLGHIAWAYNYGNRVEIHDSETRTGARAVYTSISQVTSWFGNYGCSFLGWSLWVDGVTVAEEYTPNTGKQVGLRPAKGVAKVLVDKLNVRNAASTSSPIVAQYSRGQTFRYDSYCIANGYVWLSYISYSGVRRYVAEGPFDGNAKNVWVSGGVG